MFVFVFVFVRELRGHIVHTKHALLSGCKISW